MIPVIDLGDALLPGGAGRDAAARALRAAAMSSGPAGLTSARRSALAICLTSERVRRRSKSASSGT